MMMGTIPSRAAAGTVLGRVRRPRSRRLAALFLFCLAIGAARADAQVVETPQPFDSAGRIMVITPSQAARLHLTPPAWRITGDYNEARLFALGNEGFVIVVTRPSGVVERYSVTPEERAYLRVRASTLEPDLPSQVTAGVRRAARNANRATRNAFVRDQVLLGLAIYAPSFATTITDNDAAWAAGYLLAAGSTFFGALEASRDLEITPAMHHLSTQAAVRGAGIGGLIAYGIAGVDPNDNAIAAGIFFGSVGGTAAGLTFGRHMTEGGAQAAGFGADALGGLALAGVFIVDDDAGDKFRPEHGLWIGSAALLGYPLGALYARHAPYSVTAGDVYALYVTTALGAVAALPFVVGGDRSNRANALALAAGGVLGGLAGDRFLVRRFDHSRGDGMLLGLGTGAGALMGAGLYALIKPDDRTGSSAAIWSFAAAGGVGGLLLTERYIAPDGDSGRSASSRLRFTPGSLALAAAGVPGQFPVLNFSF